MQGDGPGTRFNATLKDPTAGKAAIVIDARLPLIDNDNLEEVFHGLADSRYRPRSLPRR